MIGGVVRRVTCPVLVGRDAELAQLGAALRRAASVHVSNILAKLGVANRGEAAAVAHRLRLTG